MGRVFNEKIIEGNKLKDKLSIAENKLERTDITMAEIIEKQEEEMNKFKEEQQKELIDMKLAVAELLEEVL